MRASLAVIFFALSAIFALPSALVAQIVPPIGLAPGSQYQLIFVTADTTNATSADHFTYDSFVQHEVGQNSALPSALWSAVVSTPTSNAILTAPTHGVPIYNTQGIEVAASTIYSGSLLAPVGYDQFGNPGSLIHNPAESVWTGTTSLGVGKTDNFGNFEAQLGNDNPFGDAFDSEIGQFNQSTSTWIDIGASELESPWPIYGLSSVITSPVPEPSTLVLGIAAMAGLSFVALRKKFLRATAVPSRSLAVVAVFFLAGATPAYCDSLVYSFTNFAIPQPPDSVPAGVSASGYTDIDGGFSNSGNLAAFVANNSGPPGTHFTFFTVTPNAGKAMDLTSFSFDEVNGDSAGEVAMRWDVFSSVDNFAASLGGGPLSVEPPGSAFTNHLLLLGAAEFQNLTGPLTIRISGSGGPSTVPLDSWGLDNITLNYTLANVPEPSASVLGIAAVAGLGCVALRKKFLWA